MRVEVIGDPCGLVELGGEWAQLHQRCPDASPFQRPDWLLPWWDCLGSGKPLGVALSDGGRLVAFAPLFLHQWLGRRQITFLGNGASDRLGLLAEPGYGHAAAVEFAAILKTIGGEWDLCDLESLP